MFRFDAADAIFQPLRKLHAVEQAHIVQVMLEAQGNKVMVADILVVNLSTVYRKLNQYSVSAPTQTNGGA
jgi:DNA-binding NtrC family response regulator